MLLLPAEKLAVIVLDEALNSILKTANSGVQLTHLAKRIGELVEAEVSIIKLQKGKAGLRPWQQDILKEAYSQPSFRRTRVKLNRLVEEESWPNELKVKLGASLLSFLIDSATTESNLPAFIHTKKIMGKDKFKKVGILQLDEGQYNEIARKDMRNVQPRFLPMLVPPKCWDNKRMKDGCYFRLRSTIMR
jgi:DNA-directed RNA polymerase